MDEKVIRTIEEHKTKSGLTIRIVETLYEFGRHYVLVIGNEPGFHSVDLERVQRYQNSLLGISE